MEKTDSLLLISHVKKSFGTLEVLKDISIDVYKGDVVSILGPSGSGKTTLLPVFSSTIFAKNPRKPDGTSHRVFLTRLKFYKVIE